MNSTICFYCKKDIVYEGEKFRDINCPSCGILNSVYPLENPPQEQKQEQSTCDKWLNEEERSCKKCGTKKSDNSFIEIHECLHCSNETLLCKDCFFEGQHFSDYCIFYEMEHNKGADMGELAKRARDKSAWIKLEIGQTSEPMVYKGWKEISSQFGESFRYTFEISTEKGFVTKTFDCPQQKFAEAMDIIPFGATVVISRKQKVDGNGVAIEGKSVYEVSEVRE